MAKTEKVMENNGAVTPIKDDRLKVEALEHESIRGKTLYYLRLTDANGYQHLMNVGESTVILVRKMLAGEKLGETLTNKI